MNPKQLAEKAGFKTVTALADALKIKAPSLFQWKKIPAERAAQLEEITNGRVTLKMLRPDLFPSRKRRA
jgi:DNA-binding transcriptional regulator YdaS (Cro superfamily)